MQVFVGGGKAGKAYFVCLLFVKQTKIFFLRSQELFILNPLMLFHMSPLILFLISQLAPWILSTEPSVIVGHNTETLPPLSVLSMHPA